MIAYKALDERGLSTYQHFAWPLPKGKRPGKWLRMKDAPILCSRGFHAWKSLEKAKSEGTQVYEIELDGPTVHDHEKVAASRARLLRLAWQWEPEVIEHGLRNCQTCGKPHDRRTTRGPRSAAVWSDPVDGHSYAPEPWEDYVSRLLPDERVMGYRSARQNIIDDHPMPAGSSYNPVVPAVHGPFKTWPDHPDRCGTCGLSDGLHEGWEARKAIADEFQAYDRWELLLVIQQMRESA